MNGASQVDLKGVIAIVELDRRPSRPPDYEGKNHALSGLMNATAAQLGIHGRGFPEGGIIALQRLVETALELCRAHSVASASRRQHPRERERKRDFPLARGGGAVGSASRRGVSPSICGTLPC